MHRLTFGQKSGIQCVMNRKIPLFVLIVLLLGVVGQISATVPQATIVVNSAEDISDTTDGLCTLREAMLAANQNVESGELDDECVAGDDADTITFDLPAGTTIELTGNALTFSDTVMIEGLGAADLTIDAMGLNRVVHVTEGAVVTMTGVTLQGGAKPDNFDDGGGVFTFNGAGILNEGGLLLDDVVVQGNELSEGDGAGIHALDAITVIKNSVIRNNISINRGGGIFDRDSVTTIEDSVITNNVAASDGGGIYSTGLGELFIVRSEISDNTAANNGGGIYTSWIMSVVNSTIAANIADNGGGVYSNSDGSLPLVHTTLFNNTGGVVAAAGELVLLNTIVAHSTVDGDDCTGDIEQTGSLDSDGSCGDASTAAPRLAAGITNENGIRYYALRSVSPAIGQADISICQEVGEDQNGNERPFGIFCDIGAFESETVETAVFLPLLTAQE